METADNQKSTRPAEAVVPATSTSLLARIAPLGALTTLTALTALMACLLLSFASSPAPQTALAQQEEGQKGGPSPLALGLGSPAPNSSCSLAWRTVSPQGISARALHGVAAFASNNVWVAGGLAYRYDGFGWQPVPFPTPTYAGSVWRIAAEGPNSIWGITDTCVTCPSLVSYWDGTAWEPVPITSTQSTSLSPSDDDTPAFWSITMEDVQVIAPGQAWALETFQVGTGDPGSFLLKCNSSFCASESFPAGGPFFGISGVLGDAWAVGFGALHWNGSTWSLVPTPQVGALRAVIRVATNDVWAASDAAIIHWDGTEWGQVAGTQGANAFAALAPSDVWAVGNVIQHWNGTAWSVVPSPTGVTLYDVSATGPADVWAVGAEDPTGASKPVIEHYSAQQFGDVSPVSPFYEWVQCLACRGVVSGYADGTFGPNDPVSRGQLAKIVSNSAAYSENYTTATFADVPVGYPFHPFIERLASRGYIGGYACGGVGEPCPGTYFRPGANVTRGQTSKIVASAKGLPPPSPGQQTFEDVAPNSTFWTWIEPLATTGAIGGYPCGGPSEPCVPPNNRPYFRPNNNVTRGQSAKIVSGTFFPNCAVLQAR